MAVVWLFFERRQSLPTPFTLLRRGRFVAHFEKTDIHVQRVRVCLCNITGPSLLTFVAGRCLGASWQRDNRNPAVWPALFHPE